MITVIPMAGRSLRFKDAGYRGHKALLSMPDGRPVLSHILDSLQAQITVLVIHETDLDAIGGALVSHPPAPGTVTSLAVTAQQTRGPLDTILQAAEYLEDGGELLINYCDCWLDNIHYFLRRARLVEHDAAVAVFDSDDKRYQYGGYGRAIGGVFWFKNSLAFLNKARELELNDQTGAPQVAYAFENVAEINVTGMYIDLGTPADYEAYLEREATIKAYQLANRPLIS